MPAVSFTSFFPALGWAVLNSFWQLAFLWVVYNLLVQVVPMRSARKNRLGFILLVIGFAGFLYTISDAYTAAGTFTRQNIFYLINPETGGTFSQLLTTLLPWLAVGYLLALTAPLIRFARNYRFVSFIKTNGLQKIDVEWRLFVKKMAAYTGIRKKIQVYVSSLVQSPVTIGFLKPVILVPLSALANLTPAQVEAVLLHELIHIRQHDFLINLMARFIQSVLYFNPFAYLFIKSMDCEREKSCDELVMQYAYDPHSYASALLILEKQKTALPLFALAAAGKNYDLLHRIEHIMKVKNSPQWKRLPAIAAAFLMFFLFQFSLQSAKDEKPAGISSYTYMFSSFFSKKAAADNVSFYTSPTTFRAVKGQVITMPVLHTYKNAEEKTGVLSSTEYPQPPFTNVSYADNKPAEWDEEQQNKITTTIDATRRILEEKQWKLLEKELADAVTLSEKQQLKALVNAELARVNLETLEAKLRNSYDQINWDKLGDKLSAGINEIRMDSLQTVYTSALAGLQNMKTTMQTDPADLPSAAGPAASENLVNLKPVIEEYKARLRNNIDTIKSLRNRKIVRL